MAILKRVFFFSLVNILVVLTLSISASIILNFLGADPTQFYGMLFLYAVIGMGGAFISLLMSKWMAKRMFRIQMLDPRSQNPNERKLVELVHRIAKQAGLKTMPEVGYYNAPEVNAFATGPSKNNSLVAVSSGLLNRMSDDQVEAVLAHEVSHIANGDMVTLTLIQGVINTVVLLISRLLSAAVANALSGDRERSSFGLQYALYIVFQLVLGVLGSIVVNYFSRMREYRADAGAAKYAGRDKMISALKALGGTQELLDHEHQSFASMKISGDTRSAFAALFFFYFIFDHR
ncbi:MAG: protease HtpX, partial [Bdellovibrionales bacterium]|nr:protease HtpX [Bdellovibrionales bacterium]